ncbi:Endonuclease/exonuclease/phosphatase [Xylariomycetidae sp. FL2044]|nr:Endonuclease/exonuclease/phosphatase [Xylariomycetidae sp. FL2044]
MEQLFQEAVKRNEELKKPLDSVPWQPNQPHAQPCYSFSDTKQAWEPLEAKKQNHAGHGFTQLTVYSWNIDFMLPHAESRMNAALGHLESRLSSLSHSTAAVIYLQECVASDLATVAEKKWIRDRFYITDLDTSYWASGFYGTTTLIDRRLPVQSCFRVHYEKTNMERDAFFVDVLLGSDQDKVIRLCNSHLESMAFDPPFRPPQVQLMAKYMHEAGVHGALAAGDFNAIQPFDKMLHADNDLKDAYLDLGGKEDTDEGYTWGQQAATVLRERFGCSRMDKVFFCGNLKLHRFERFGADILLSEDSERDELVGLGFEKPWITDHLGVMTEVSIVE